MNPDPQETTLNLRDLLAFVARGAIAAALLAGVAAAGVYLWTVRQPAVYRAEATLLVARAAGSVAQFGVTSVTAPPIDLGAYRVVVTSDQVLGDALMLMGEAEPRPGDIRSLRSRVGTSTETGVRDSSLLRVAARGASVASAVDSANAVANALIAWDRRRASESIDRVITTLTLQIEALSEQIRVLQTGGDPAGQGQIDGLIRLRAEQQQQLAYARALVASADGMLSVLQTADASPRQIAPRPVASAVIAALVAVIATYGLLLLQVALSVRLRGSDDVVRVTGLPVLAEFPSVGRLEGPRLREAASYLRTNLLFATEGVHPRVFMVTSSVEHEGKTTIARSLAEGFVRYGYRTLLIDADLRAPSVVESYEVMGTVPDAATTESWLTDPHGAHQILSVKLDAEGKLDVVPQFKPVANASELLGRGIRTVLGSCQEYDVVIIDTPPVLAVADSLTIAPHCTGTVLVVDPSRTDRRKLSMAVGTLQQVGVQVLGVVTNKNGSAGSGLGNVAPYGSPYAEATSRRSQPRRPAPAVVRTNRDTD